MAGGAGELGELGEMGEIGDLEELEEPGSPGGRQLGGCGAAKLPRLLISSANWRRRREQRPSKSGKTF
jgi:hypothetical protein